MELTVAAVYKQGISKLFLAGRCDNQEETR